MGEDHMRAVALCIYGATGFTGARVAEYVVTAHPELSVLLVGRDEAKLAELAARLRQTARRENGPGSASAATQVAEAGDHDALVAAFGRCRVVLNCAGPYRYTGLLVAAAAVDAGTHYLDLCGEPEFFDRVLLQLDARARERGVLVASACAFDCVPAELTAALVLGKRSAQAPPPALVRVLHRVSVGPAGARGFATTWRAAVDGFAAAQRGELAAVRRQVKAAGFEEPPRVKRRAAGSSSLPSVLRLLPQWDRDAHVYTLPFPGADAASVRMSQRYLSRGEAPTAAMDGFSANEWPALTVDAAFETLRGALTALLVGLLLKVLSQARFGATLLKRYPRVFSLGAFSETGPSEEQLNSTFFRTEACAFANDGALTARAALHGPEPGYRATPRIAVALARLALEHIEGRNALRTPLLAGAMLPGAAFFARAPLRARAVALLREEGIKVDEPHGA